MHCKNKEGSWLLVGVGQPMTAFYWRLRRLYTSEGRGRSVLALYDTANLHIAPPPSSPVPGLTEQLLPIQHGHDRGGRCLLASSGGTRHGCRDVGHALPHVSYMPCTPCRCWPLLLLVSLVVAVVVAPAPAAGGGDILPVGRPAFSGGMLDMAASLAHPHR